MNILAHGYLSGTGLTDRHTDLLIGNFIGDFIKGDPSSPRHNLTSGEIVGVRVHRAIDSFTDAHPDVAAVRELLHPRCHKYAGAAVDIFFDHFLAINFEQLTGESLPDFVHYFYKTLQANRARLPASAAHMADYMIRQDWLTNYQFVEGIDRSLKGVSRRTAYPSGLDTAIEDLERYYLQIGEHFTNFWPTLVEHIQRTRTAFASLL
ncbi:acyl carrier protein phosphodiesterase [Spirosoma flavum]|uniref:ACP phosphodiesterase n=1 Tax=Spirosoma flavum TaxID=2048557 RepID=A0ABW6AK26_9BACT